jgi:hypothetical protein
MTKNFMPDPIDPKAALLEPLETTAVPATSMPVIVRDFFIKNSGVKIAAVWSEFKARFFDKPETPIAGQSFQKYKLLRISPDGPIIEKLGGESKVESTVTAAMSLLRRQGNGGPGFLQTNGYANIFYSKDKNGVLCAIRIGWADDGWVIDAISAQDPLAWNGKHEIFCPV